MKEVRHPHSLLGINSLCAEMHTMLLRISAILHAVSLALRKWWSGKGTAFVNCADFFSIFSPSLSSFSSLLIIHKHLYIDHPRTMS